VMVHFRPLPRRLPPRGALNDVLTSTCSVQSDRRTGRNGSTPISHILVVYGGLLMNYSAEVGRRLQISTPQIYIHRYFDDTVAGVRAATAGADPPPFTQCPVGSSFITFRPVTTDDVLELVRTLPDKSCLSDPLPTWLLKKNVDVLAPFLCRLSIVPPSFKSGYITPLLKKADVDADDVKPYQLLLITERLLKVWQKSIVGQVLHQLLNYNGLLPDLQSAYRAHHST